MSFSVRLTPLLLFTFGAAYALIGQQRHDYLSVATALCLCVSAAGLFSEDLIHSGYRRDRAVLVHVAAHPGAQPAQIARALGVAETAVVVSLVRLAEDGRVEEGTPESCSYRLAG